MKSCSRLAARADITSLMPGWRIRWLSSGCHGWWWHWWTPKWHRGRGPYISIGCGLFAIYRGY